MTERRNGQCGPSRDQSDEAVTRKGIPLATGSWERQVRDGFFPEP